MTEEIPKVSEFMMKEENENLSSALLRHGMTLEEDGLVTIIASLDQEAGIGGGRFAITGVKCSGVFKAASLWKTAAPNLMCKVEVDLEDFEFPRSGSQPRNLSLWRDGSEAQLSFYSLDNNNEANNMGEDDVMEAELCLRAVIMSLDMDRAEIILGAIPMSRSRLEEFCESPGSEKIPMLPVLEDTLTMRMGPQEYSDKPGIGRSIQPILEMNQKDFGR